MEELRCSCGALISKLYVYSNEEWEQFLEKNLPLSEVPSPKHAISMCPICMKRLYIFENPKRIRTFWIEEEL